MPNLKKTILLISLSLFILFILFSYFAARNHFDQTDFDTTVKIQDKLSRRVDLPFSYLSVMGSIEVTGTFMFLLLIFMLVKRYFLTSAALFLLPLALAMEVFGKVFVHHPAPPYLFYRGIIRFDFFPTHYVPHDYSYPSGHMLRMSFILSFLAVFAFLKLPRKYSLVIIAVLAGLYLAMGVSRVYLGEHWTSDVIGGALIGSSFGVLAASTIPLKKKTVKKVKIITEEEE